MRLFSLPRWRALAASILATALAAACGGGGGSPGACVSGSAPVCAGEEGTPSAQPGTSAAVAGICTPDAMKQFTRAHLNERYLWYAEMPSVNAANYSRIDDYFYSLLTPLLDPAGQPKDRFSFIASTQDADSLLTGSNVGYGVRWETDTQGRQRVAFVDAGSPALAAGLARGGELVQVLTPNASWFPNAPATVSFVYRTAPGAQTYTVTLESAAVQEDPLPLVQTLASPAGRKVAYLLFNAHTVGAQDKLIPAIQAAQAAGVQDVVLDLRYNGGGYLYPALALSSMLADTAADGRVFEQLRFNDKRPAETDASVLRFSGAVQFGETGSPEGTPLPRLGLPRVFLLTSAGTCSASESIVNSLRGVGVEVVIVGKATCGKPYGFSRRDNCGFSYFPIEFQGVNALGFGDYANGFAPTCDLADDFDHGLGAPAERLLWAALVYADTGACPAPGAAAPLSARKAAAPLQWPLLRGKVLAPPAADR
ncbi:MAG: S41 family peptidase [Ramlibacter sp.]|nr:S41 family peptidase [Ramlibacter sp.]